MQGELTDDLPSDILILIGQINVGYGQLEHVLKLTIKRTTEGLSLEEATKMARSLGWMGLRIKARTQFEKWALDQRMEKKFKIRLDHADCVVKRRHDVAHGVWGKDDRGNLYWERADPNKDPATELQEIRGQLRNLIRRMEKFTRVAPTRSSVQSAKPMKVAARIIKP
jgi:hypothetical protein